MSAAAPFEALAASMHFRKNAPGGAVSGEKENAGGRILLPCLKQLQAQRNDIENMKENTRGNSDLYMTATTSVHPKITKRQIWSAVGSMAL